MASPKPDAFQFPESGTSPIKDTLDSPVSKFDRNYNMEHAKRGQALIFSHLKYDDDLNLSERNGTEADCLNLLETLSKMNFEVSVHKDFSHEQITERLEEVSNADHSEEDCLLIAVMTHGDEKDVLYAKDEEYQVDELWENFTVMNCPTLAAKPKIFLIQACRGGNRDNFAMKMSAQSDAIPSREEATLFKIPNFSDFIFMFSTIPSFVSWRNRSKGSWLIEAFCKVMGEDMYADDFLSLLTRTSHKLITDYDQMNVMQTGCITSMLTRKIFFESK